MIVRIIYVVDTNSGQVAVHFDCKGDYFTWKVLRQGQTLTCGELKHLQFPSPKLAHQVLGTISLS